jgi:ketosteroid isomerase-like protein
MAEMKKSLFALALLAWAVFAALAQEKNTAIPLTKAVLGLEQQWEDALTKSDVAALDKLYDETLVYTHSNGKVDTKTSYIAAIKEGAVKYESMKRDDIKVSLYGHTAVVTCHWAVHVLARGNKLDLDARYLHVYVEQADGWKLVAHESTKVAP